MGSLQHSAAAALMAAVLLFFYLPPQALRALCRGASVDSLMTYAPANAFMWWEARCNTVPRAVWGEPDHCNAGYPHSKVNSKVNSQRLTSKVNSKVNSKERSR